MRPRRAVRGAHGLFKNADLALSPLRRNARQDRTGIRKRVADMTQKIELQKVRAGFYRYGRLCIHGGSGKWGVYDGPKFVAQFNSLGAVLGGVIGTSIGVIILMTCERLWDYSKRPGKWFK